MAVTSNSNILAMLKVWYKDGVENLMFRNSPLLGKIKKERVEGKQQNFNALYGRGGAVSGDFTKALANAASVARDVEFQVTPGQIFSVYTMNAKEVQASLSSKGAYMKVAGGKMFAAAEAFRKTMAAALYGRGFGELCVTGYTTAITVGTAFSITLPASAVIKIDVGSQLSLKSSVGTSTVNATLTVTAINGETVTFTSDTAVASPAATDILCLSGSMDSSGNPILPVGLGGWLPTVGARTGSDWTTYIGTSFFGVNRSLATDRLAGAFYQAASTTEKISTTIQNLLKKVRRQGSKADLIVMNDADFLTFSEEIASTNTYFTATSTKAKRQAATGFDAISASFSTNYIENVFDDPYCPQGTAYILDSETVKFWSYTNVDKLNDGINGNDPGKQDPMAMNDEGKSKDPYGLVIDDYLAIQSGTPTIDGPSTNVALQCFGSYVVQNPSVCGVALLAGATPLEA